MEPLSPHLSRLMADLRLCTPADLRACRGRVRRLARDVPAFDFVWIDALLQAGKLTPFQARILESNAPRALQVGPCVLLDQLGEGPQGATFLARPRERDDLYVLKLVKQSEERLAESGRQVGELLHRMGEFRHPAIVFPHSSPQSDGQLILISRYVGGPNLAELLVRRGRFPAPIVQSLARRMLEGLGQLHSARCVHGDIRLPNIRLTPTGRPVLVDACINPAVSPSLTIHAGWPPERYDGVAPELIGTGQQPSPLSDLYAVGCLLYELLAGRPPFPTGDPLAKLAAHQTRLIGDVRTWAPETPASLAELILKLTRRSPVDRPQSAADAIALLGKVGRGQQKQLKAFRSQFSGFDRVLPLQRSPQPIGVLPVVAACLFAISGASLALLDQGARTELLRIAAGVPERIRTAIPETTLTTALSGLGQGGSPGPTTPPPDTPARLAEKLQPLPLPGPDGVIRLTTAGPYEAAEISAVGPILLEAAAGIEAEIVIRNRPLTLWADQVSLRGVTLRADASHSNGRPDSMAFRSLIKVHAQVVTVDSCRFRGLPVEPLAAKSSPWTAIAWSLLDEQDRSGGELSVRDSLFEQVSVARARQCPMVVQIENTLLLNAESVVTLPLPDSSRSVQLQLSHVTSRQSGPLVRVPWGDPLARPGFIDVRAVDCIFDLRTDVPTALFELVSDAPPASWQDVLTLTGEGSVTRAGVVIAGLKSAEAGEAVPLETDGLRIEGIVTGPFEFTGPATTAAPVDSTVSVSGVPRRSSEPPGIDVERLAKALLPKESPPAEPTSASEVNAARPFPPNPFEPPASNL